MTRTALSALLAHWRQRPGQLLTLVLGLALATALWSAVQAINAEARARYAEAAARFDQAATSVITQAAGPFHLSDYAALRRAGWPVTPELDGRIAVGNDRLPLLGVDLLGRATAGSGDGEGSPAVLLTAPGRLLARADLAERLDGAPGLPPVLVWDAAPPGQVLTDIGTATRLLDRPDQIDRLRLTGPVPDHAPPLANLLPGAVLTRPDAPDTASLTDSFHLNLTAFGMLSFAVGLFIVNGTVGLAFAQRRGMIRTLRALGVSMRRLVWLILAVLLVVSFTLNYSGRQQQPHAGHRHDEVR